MKWKPVPLPDGSYADANKPFSSQDLINYYPELAQAAGTRSQLKLVGCPGLREYLTFGDGPVRAFRNVEGNLFCVSDTGAFWIKSETDVVLLGTVPGRGHCWISHNQIAGGSEVMFSTGPDAWIWNTVEETWTKVTDEAFRGARSLDYLNSRFIGIEQQRRFFANSELADGMEWNALERYESESAPDRLVCLLVSQGYVYVFNERTTELFYNTTDEADIANHILFRRAGNSAIEVGCASPFGAVNLDNAIFFIGSDGLPYELRGSSPRLIGSPPICKAWQDCDISKAFCFTYEQDGHKFWYTTFPDGLTWGYDVSTQKWHRRQSKGMDRWRVNCVVKWKGPDDDAPQWYAGSYNSGMIWRIDPDYMREGCDEHIRTFRTGVGHDEGNRVFTHGIRIEYDSGSEESVCADVEPVVPDVADPGAGVSIFLASGNTPEILSSLTGETWDDITTPVAFDFMAGSPGRAVANDSSGNFYYSHDRGDTWTLSASGPFAGVRHIAYTQGVFVCLKDVAGTISAVVSTDFGVTWAAGGTLAATTLNDFAAGEGVFVAATGNTNPGIWISQDNGATWQNPNTTAMAGVGYNGTGFLAGALGFLYSADGISWGSLMGGTVPSLAYAISGGPGYFCVGTFANGIYRTTNNGVSFGQVQASAARLYSTAVADGTKVVFGSGDGGSASQYWSDDSGLTFALINPGIADNDICAVPP